MSRPRLALSRWPLRRAAAGAFAALVLAFSATAVITHPGTSPAAGGTHVWTGGGSFPVFDDVASWDVGTVPGVGADLVFTGSPSAVTPNNDLSGLAVNSVTFDAAATAAFTITGNPITLEATTGTLTNLSANLQTINAPLNLTNAAIAGGSGGLLLTSALTGSASQTGGTVTITSGGALAYTVGSGATLQTDAATAWVGQDVTVSSGGTLVPNPGGIGALTGIGQVTIAGTLQASLTASASDAITAVDTTLSGPLAVSLTGTPTAGQVFTLITTTGSNPVSGTFSGLPQGATLTAGGETFTISYLGGSGNDVVLIAGEVPGLPANVEATPGHLSASVSFDTPTSTAGAIDQYEVTAIPTVGSPWTATGASSPINVTGLVLGQDYTFTVRARNAAGWGASSNPSSAIQPDSRPGTPSITQATPTDQTVTVDFTPPVANGGTAPTGYTVSATPTGGGVTQTQSGAGDPISGGLRLAIGGLTNGVSYDLTVHATNPVGDSPESSVVVATPRTTPGAPTIGTATAENGSAMVTFTAPVGTGGSPITGYRGVASPGAIIASAGAGATSITFPVLTNGIAHTFTVQAENAAGFGLPSAASNPVTPGGQVRTWIGGSGNNFSTAANWAGGIAPLAGDLVHLGGAGGSVVVDVADTHVGSLTFDNGAGAFSISGNRLFVDGNLTNLSSNDHVFIAHLGIDAATTIDTGTRTITINGNVNGAGSIVKAGSGTLLVTASSNTFTGPVTVQAGTLETDADANVPALTVASTGTLLVGGAGTAGTLTVNGALDIASTLAVDVTGDTTGDRIVVTGTVTLSGGLALGTATVGAPASALDLVTNDLADAVSGTFSTVAEGSIVTSGPATYRVTYVGGTGNDLQLVHVAAPSAPTGVTAVPFDRSAQVSFPMAPTGLPTTYTVTASPGGTSAVGTSPVTVTGLTNGVAYTFTVTADNDLGDATSSPTSAVTPVAKPTAPTGAAAVAGDGSATITFGAAADNGSPISAYTVVASPGGATASGAGSPIVVGGLANGTAYTFIVRATNAHGDGPDSSTTNAVVPAGVPFAPTGLTATPSSGQVRLTWSAAPGNGTAVTAYRISVQPTGRTITVTSGTSVRFVGLTNGTTYTYSVKAVNAVGEGVASADVTATPEAVGTGYWMLEANGAVHVFGSATDLGGVAGQLGFGVTAADLEPTPNGRGYWIVDSVGKVTALGEAPALGSADTGAFQSGERVASISSSASGNGYWLFTNRGRVQAFGDAPFLGDVSSLSLNGGVVGSIPTPSGLGYYMVASDGGIFAFGDAGFFGSMGGAHLNAPVNGLVPDPDGTGYWLVASDGGIFAFDAGFHGSMGAVSLNRAVVGMVRFGTGYLMVGADGGVFNFSDQQYFGSLGANPPANPIVGIAVLEQ